MGLRFALVAGEASGDLLGAALIRALRERFPGASFSGVAGPRMAEAGCEVLAPVETLSVMGFAEVVRHLPRILSLRRRLLARFGAERPDLYIGIDAPDFNLGIERALRAGGLRTAHVVSPSVWAWRQGRVHGIARSVDLMLCLLPFEPRFYDGHGVRAAYVGHPLADELDDSVPPAQARAALGLPAGDPVVAVLPGSRGFEAKYLAPAFAQAAALLARSRPALRFVVPVARPHLRPAIDAAIARHAPGLRWHLLDGQSRAAMQSADAVLIASGTATLECLLLGRPMVIAYKASPVSVFIVRRLVKVRHAGLPNLLTDQPRVPELLQEDATPERLAAAVEALLAQPEARARQLESFDAVRRELRRGAAARAAAAIAELLAAAPADPLPAVGDA
ncbi:MAG TPA: lipid-A-disaccharide synthase [Candidatus Binatia bacterium]|nr:lipid-A-disaccharide synthase [Candidatus Binatia bacterium]